MTDRITRRQFMRNSAVTATALVAGFVGTEIVRAGAANVDIRKILNYNPQMEYRRLGRTNLMISAASLGGHWKRIVKVVGGEEPAGWMTMDIDNPAFQKNRLEVVNRCIDRGINYVDACCREEILAYARAQRPPRQDVLWLFLAHHRKPLPRMAIGQETQGRPRRRHERGRPGLCRPLADQPA